MKLIERICQKYDGELKTQVEDGKVVVIAYLRVRQEVFAKGEAVG